MICNTPCHYKDPNYIAGVKCCLRGRVLGLVETFWIMVKGCAEFRERH